VAQPDWFGLARRVLDAVVAGYTVRGVDLPARRFVAPAFPAYHPDGWLSVHASRTYSHSGRVSAEVNLPLGDRSLDELVLRSLEVQVTLMRCRPGPHIHVDLTADVPSPAEEEDVARAVLADAGLLVDCLADAQAAGALAGCSSLSVGAWQSLQAQGGVVGGSLRVVLGV
jgi:hypothetical protein